MGFTTRPLPRGVLVFPPRARAAMLFAAAAWNFVLGSIGGRLWDPNRPIEPLFFTLGMVGGAALALWALRALFPARIEWGGGRFRCRPMLPWPRAVDLPLAEVEALYAAPTPRVFSHPSPTVFVRTVDGVDVPLPLLMDSFVIAVNGTGAIVFDGRAKPANVQALVEHIRAGIDDARHESVGYRRVATGPEPLDPDEAPVADRRHERS